MTGARTFARGAAAAGLLGGLAAACAGRPSAQPRARGEVATLLVMDERGEAAVVADAAHVFVVTWHGVVRASHTGEAPVSLYAAPLGGVAPSVVAADPGRIYVVEARACDDDDGFGVRRPSCARIVAVPKDGAPPAVLAALPPGDVPTGLAADGGYVYFALKRRVARVPRGGGGVVEIAQTEDDAQSVVAQGGSVLWVEADLQAATPAGALVTHGARDRRVVVGAADPARGRLAAAGRWVYWIGDDRVWRADARGGAPESLGEARARAGDARLAADAAGVVWTEGPPAQLALLAAGGAAVRVALEGERPTSVALAGPFAFVATVHEADGGTRVLRVTR